MEYFSDSTATRMVANQTQKSLNEIVKTPKVAQFSRSSKKNRLHSNIENSIRNRFGDGVLFLEWNKRHCYAFAVVPGSTEQDGDEATSRMMLTVITVNSRSLATERFFLLCFTVHSLSRMLQRLASFSLNDALREEFDETTLTKLSEICSNPVDGQEYKVSTKTGTLVCKYEFYVLNGITWYPQK